VVAGVPPDYFSADGQLWGNPAYNWNALRGTGFRWWVERIRTTFELVDRARIDHFRGIVASWNVIAGSESAREGQWTQGPGKELFDAIGLALGEVPIIVEDLGIITPDVHLVRRELGFPGMKVLQFAFDGDPANAYLPHTYDEHCVVYSGTHDNDTTVGWFQGLDWEAQERVRAYLGRDGQDIAWDLIRLAFASVATLAIVPMQDVLRLGSDARMNVPGAALGNWGWRYRAEHLSYGLADGLRQFATIYNRLPLATTTSGYDPYDYTAPGTAHPLLQE
jgi:4-alpha-glucanotransferase